jgi:Tfp pilus assembly PilM family ATPase
MVSWGGPHACKCDLTFRTMRPLLTQIDRISQRMFYRSVGWTGIEIGCHTINMAQVRRLHDRWHLAAVWSLEHPTSQASEPEASSPHGLEHFGWLETHDLLEDGLSRTLECLEKLNSLFDGRHCAATLTDGMIAYRELDLPTCELPELKAMVRSEIALESESEPEELLTDCWDLPRSNPKSTTACFGAVSIKRSAALRVASDLLRAGFECQTLDAMPCAMARATSMVVDDDNDVTLAIDLGFHQAMLTLVKAGQPVLTRGVRSLGLLALLEQISKSFELHLSDAKTLLFQSAPNLLVTAAKPSEEFANPIHQQRSVFLQSLSSEINKTTQFAQRAYRFAPNQLLLMGAGTQIPFLNESISERTGLPAQSWCIELSENLFGNQPAATFAIAAGLSALAWETT